MKENSEEKYELKDYSLLGISFYTVTRKIVKREVASKNMKEKRISISSLFLSMLPQEINNNLILWGNFNWDQSCTNLIKFAPQGNERVPNFLYLSRK
jgi:hypothetical protein